MARGPDYLLWALLDALVDDYFPVFDRLEDEIDDLEDRIVERARTRTRWSSSSGSSASSSSSATSCSPAARGLQPAHEPDAAAHRARARHLLPGHLRPRASTCPTSTTPTASWSRAALDVYLSTVNNNLSLIMKRLTGITVSWPGSGRSPGSSG